MTTEVDLYKAMQTAYVHCRQGGVALFEPDNVKETFKEMTKRGGSTQKGNAMRYLEWVYDPDPNDTECVADFAYMLREGSDTMTVEHDRHIFGLFPRQTWLSLLEKVGFEVENIVDDWDRDIFISRKR
jgi:hypothetical protein